MAEVIAFNQSFPTQRVDEHANMPWFRSYRSDLHDRKLQELPLAVFKTAINIRNVVSHLDGELPELGEVAYALRLKPEKAHAHIEALLCAGLLERRGAALFIAEWKQFRSDDDRKNKEIQRLKRKSPRTRPKTVPTQRERESPSETQTYNDRWRDRESESAIAPANPNGTMMSMATIPNQINYQDATVYGLGGNECDIEFESFRDYHLAHGSRRVDWNAAFRSWLSKIDNFSRAG